MSWSPRTATIDLGTPVLDELRRTDFTRLATGGHRYFDYTGSGLYAERQIRRHHERLLAGTFGNPHSLNPTSVPATELVEAARASVLDWFGATAHDCIFTANATAAIKLVGESWDFATRARLLLTADNHNSVNGLREYARHAGARTLIAPLETPSLRLDLDVLRVRLADRDRDGGLFALPAQSNYSGVQHPLEVVGLAAEQGWSVLLDAAAFAPTNPLHLDSVPADFTAVSFYKMFGFPTGVGALIVRRDALGLLRRPWFAGGTITLASVAADEHRLAPGHAGFEDGTPNFGSIPAVGDGLELLGEVGIDAVHERVQRATAVLLSELAALRHPGGGALVEVLGPNETGLRGGTIAFDLLDPDGVPYEDRRVQELAAERRISLRSGCFCNPGVGEAARGYGRLDMAELFERPGPTDMCDVDEHFRRLRGRGASALRASVGWVTDAADLAALVSFFAGFEGVTAPELGPPAPRTGPRPDSP